MAGLRDTVRRVNGFLTPNKGLQRLSGVLAMVAGVASATPCFFVADSMAVQPSDVRTWYAWSDLVLMWLALILASMIGTWLLVRAIAWVVAGFRE